jgi:hypothetical protein
MNVKNAWSLRNLYLYVVCLITLVMTIVATVNVVRAIVDLAYPNPGYYMTVPAVPVDGKATPDPAQLQQQQEIQRQQEENQRQQATRNAVLNLVGSGAMLIVAGPVYVYHWRKIERESASPAS